MSLRFSAAVLCAVLSSVLPLSSAKAQTSPVGAAGQPAYASDSKFTAAMNEARQLEHRREFSFAGDDYKKANKIAGGRCMDCLMGLYSAQISAGSYKDAANTASTMETMAATPGAKSLAEYHRADALLLQAGDKPKPDKLEAVHSVLQESIGTYPKNAAALFLDGKVLAQLGRMDEARAEFTQCISCVNPNDPGKLRAEHFAEDPELSLHKMAPPIVVTALDGSKFNLDAMGGRVVLIDFWATWCGPCNVELPHIKQIAKEFAGQPLVIISVSWDADEAKWKDFIAKHDMTWVQYRDADHKLSEEFGVQAIPHYFTIDSDGVLTAEMLGEGSDVEGKLKKLLAKAHQAHKETVASSPAVERIPAD